MRFSKMHGISNDYVYVNGFTEQVDDPADVRAAVRRMLDADGPYLLDIRIPRDQSVFPMIAPGGALSQVIGVIDSAGGNGGLRLMSEGEQLGGAR